MGFHRPSVGGTVEVTEMTAPANKGGLVVGDGTGAPQELTVGTNGYVLTANSTTDTGVEWAKIRRTAVCSVYPPGTNNATGDGKFFFRVPSTINGWNLISVAAQVYTAGTTGSQTIQIRRTRSGSSVDMLSTPITIDTTETDSSTAAAAVINTSNDDVATGDRIAVDIDAVHTTPAQGLSVELIFEQA